MKTVSVRDARANFSDLLGSVYYTNIPVMVEKKGKPIAVFVNPSQYRQLEKIKAEGWTVVDELRAKNVNKDPDKIYKEATKVVGEVRQEMYEKKQNRNNNRSH